jgi:hypothetical protein
MASQIADLEWSEAEPVLRDCVDTLRTVATYRLPKAVDQRLLWLSENKERLDELERDELVALADFSEQRTLEKVQAQAVLKRLGDIYPQLLS